TAMVEESAAASQRLNGQASDLRQQVASFDLGQVAEKTFVKKTAAKRKTGSKSVAKIIGKKTASTYKSTSKPVAAKPVKKPTVPNFPKAGTVEDDDVWEEF
ncbi:MAG: hypothetical protein JKY80_06215, partial [Mariprofundaceae bacterium]|nr:hypothetical protein [Mariprofundaceae bacterium]